MACSFVQLRSSCSEGLLHFPPWGIGAFSHVERLERSLPVCQTQPDCCVWQFYHSNRSLLLLVTPFPLSASRDFLCFVPGKITNRHKNEVSPKITKNHNSDKNHKWDFFSDNDISLAGWTSESLDKCISHLFYLSALECLGSECGSWMWWTACHAHVKTLWGCFVIFGEGHFICGGLSILNFPKSCNIVTDVGCKSPGGRFHTCANVA